LKTLLELMEGLSEDVNFDSGKIQINNIVTDSRRVGPGDLFVALAGTVSDGHDFVHEAVASGAAVVVTQRKIDGVAAPCLVVPDTQKALAEVAARYFGRPADSLFKCGITGTNGKTSVSFLYRSIIEVSGWGGMGIVGTLGHGVGDGLEKTVHTTPDQVKLHALFREMVDSGCSGVVMEVSSHAVRQHRAWGLEFDVGILTNVTHDHLDFHKTIEDYRAAKREFCNALENPSRQKPAGVLVYSVDDPVAREIGLAYGAETYAVTVAGADDHQASDRIDATRTTIVSAGNVCAGLDGTRFTLAIGAEEKPVEINMKLLGSFCAVNAAFAAAAARATGVPVLSIKKGLEELDRIPGRFEAIGGSGKPVVIIDYCHTPDALCRVLQTCRDLNPCRLSVVFGCGGDRDRLKRPEMGRISQELADAVVLTTDNPRSERVESIIEEIVSGMDKKAEHYRVELDRGRAIHEAVAAAGPGDVVALLGKGVEEYQIVGAEWLPFSDRAEAEDALIKWKSR
jgi:UDP-N-acetylmuramoyl-L-alanyl-D-glutamate--2,6-diaminopimelate ligase